MNSQEEQFSSFTKSSFCQDGGCVGVAVAENDVAVRDEKNPDGGYFTVSHRAWMTFLGGIRVNQHG